mmetsp:Transcript_6078/g.11509  ORF Transcript_6078/g.11509 Transcript_6078/m.11509 type:complete len:1075 (-) Transcript_6078:196-3420(-)
MSYADPEETDMDFLDDPREAWARNSINYTMLQEKIQRLHLFDGEKQFNTLLDKEVAKVDHFYNQKIKELRLKNYPCADKQITFETTEELTRDILRLEEYVNRNIDFLVSILKKHDENSNYALTPSHQWKIQRNGFCDSEQLESLLMRLSSQYEHLNKSKHSQEEKSNMANATTVFERKSFKFWIKSHDVVQVICDIVKHLPIFSFGRQHHFSQPTSSVYYDDENLNLYAVRLVKEENSTLIRFRWYNELTKDSMVFVERKVHHESWVLAESNKMRFPLKHDHVLGFVQGSYQPTQEFLAKHPLFMEIQQKVLNEGLQPCLLTTYDRSAFQMENDDSVRLSLDTNLMMKKESGVDMRTHWRNENGFYSESEVHRFPFAVLEVKLHAQLLEAPPPWVRQLTSSGLLIRVDKFSKYAHGVAMLYPLKVKTLPYWLDENFRADVPDDDELVDDYDEHHENQANLLDTTREAGAEPSRPGGFRGEYPGERFSPGADTLSRTGRATIYSKAAGIVYPVQVSSKKSVKYRLKQVWQFVRTGRWELGNRHPRIEGALKIEPKTFFANERTYLQWFNAATVMGSVAIAMMGMDNTDSQAIGKVFLPIAMVVSIYALGTFHWRSFKLRRRDPSTSYSDRWGPTGLTVIFLVVITMALYRGASDPVVVVAPDPKLGYSDMRTRAAKLCNVGRSLSPPPNHRFDATDLTFHHGMNQLVLVSKDGRIGYLDPALGDSTVASHFWLPPLGPTAFAAVASLPAAEANPPTKADIAPYLTATTPLAGQGAASASPGGESGESGESGAGGGGMEERAAAAAAQMAEVGRYLAQHVYLGIEFPPAIVELRLDNFTVTRVLDLSQHGLVSGQFGKGLSGLALVPDFVTGTYLFYAASKLDGLVTVLEFPDLANTAALAEEGENVLVRAKFFPFAGISSVTGLGSVPQAGLQTLLTLTEFPKPPGYTLKKGSFPQQTGVQYADTLASAQALPPATSTSLESLAYHQGYLHVAHSDVHVSKAFSIGPNGLPAKNLASFRAYSLRVDSKGMAGLAVGPGSAAYASVEGSVFQLQWDAGSGFSFCQDAYNWSIPVKL